MVFDEQHLQHVAAQFQYEGTVKAIQSFGQGHINDTFVCDCEQDDGSIRQYILQNINTRVFTRPDLVMENIVSVTRHLRSKIVAFNGDPEREALSIIHTIDGQTHVRQGSFAWRSYDFITGATTHDVVRHNRQAFEAARTFGLFQRLLADLQDDLHETIPHFHDTPKRLRDLEDAIERDSCNRLASCRPEVEAALQRRDMVSVVTDALANGDIPLRVTHNDTKINNVLFDGQNGHAICVIDLDTVMPGSSLYDFGDMVRTSTGEFAENERDLSCVRLKLDRFQALVTGYLEEAHHVLNQREIELLAFSGRLITFEIGIRFLTDYLEGDVYFKTHRPGENLDRARTQLHFVAEQERASRDMEAIVQAMR